jgi:hypothetical protein
MHGILPDTRIDQDALFALESPLSKGVILADEVGLGNTIEAAARVTNMHAFIVGLSGGCGSAMVL